MSPLPGLQPGEPLHVEAELHVQHAFLGFVPTHNDLFFAPASVTAPQASTRVQRRGNDSNLLACPARQAIHARCSPAAAELME